MNVFQSFKMAFSAILGNKMRSFLTMLGIIIGVFAVVVLVSIVQGATGSVTSQLEGMGTNTLSVSITGYRTEFSYQDAMELAELENVDTCAPYLSGNATLRANNETYTTTLYGSNEDYLLAQGYELYDGRNLNLTDLENRFQVAVIGTDVADEVFGYRDVVGETMRVNGSTYKIIGVVEEQTESFMGSANDYIIIPFDTAARLLQTKSVRQVTITAKDSDGVAALKTRLEQAVEKKVGEDNYRVNSFQELLNTLNDTLNTMTLLLGGVAAISLLVGGIGIMNIMLVSVTERTREIGIRKAIGAKGRDILSQFLIEAIVITLLGGVIALGLSYVALTVVGGYMGMELGMSSSIIALGMAFCLVIGVVFGVYPANKAAKLNPIEALRHE